MKVLRFIPVYNQIHELPIVLSELKSEELCCDEVLLVNNGSNDGSEELIRESGYQYLDFSENKGVGFGIMKATEWAMDNKFDVLVGLAGNGKMLPSEMHRVVEPILKGEADYVTGSRFLAGGESPNLPNFRKRSIPMVNVFVRCLTGKTLTDATCGYRAMRLDIMERAHFDWKASWLYTYGFEYYLYGKVLLSSSVRWKEVPITMRYPQKGKRYTKIRPFVGWYEMLKPWVLARIDAGRFV